MIGASTKMIGDVEDPQAELADPVELLLEGEVVASPPNESPSSS